MKYYFLLLFSLSLLPACGDGNINVDSTAGTPSVIGGETTDKTPLEYFRDEIFPIISESSLANGGCASSGCHLVNSAAQSAQTFFQVDPDSADISWNWASVRRTSITDTDYSVSSGSSKAQLLRTQIEANHKNTNWTAVQKSKMETWSAITE